MSRAQKLLEKIRNNPGAVAFDDLHKVLCEAGFRCRQPKGGSSHFIYTCGTLSISVPYKRPYVKQHYVKLALGLIDRVLEDESDKPVR